MKKLKEIKRDAIIGIHSLFQGLKGADAVISQNASYGGGGTEINQQQTADSIFGDFLNQQETERVKEERDRYYRVLREADKYQVKVIGMESAKNDEEGADSTKMTEGALTTTTRKKVAADYLKHAEIYNEENLPIRLIQDIKLIPLENNFTGDFSKPESEQYVSNITIERDDFMPRFRLENRATKLVVKTTGENTARLDFYTSIYASQFSKVDALFVSEFNRIKTENNKRSDTTSFTKISFYTDKAFGADDLCYFEYDDIKFVGIEVFDGNFVLQFDAHVVKDGEYVGDKYKTEELTEKYKNNAPKGDATDIFAIERKLKKEEAQDNEINLETTTLKLS